MLALNSAFCCTRSVPEPTSPSCALLLLLRLRPPHLQYHRGCRKGTCHGRLYPYPSPEQDRLLEPAHVAPALSGSILHAVTHGTPLPTSLSETGRTSGTTHMPRTRWPVGRSPAGPPPPSELIQHPLPVPRRQKGPAEGEKVEAVPGPHLEVRRRPGCCMFSVLCAFRAGRPLGLTTTRS